MKIIILYANSCLEATNFTERIRKQFASIQGDYEIVIRYNQLYNYSKYYTVTRSDVNSSHKLIICYLEYRDCLRDNLDKHIADMTIGDSYTDVISADYLSIFAIDTDEKISHLCKWIIDNEMSDDDIAKAIELDTETQADKDNEELTVDDIASLISGIDKPKPSIPKDYIEAAMENLAILRDDYKYQIATYPKLDEIYQKGGLDAVYDKVLDWRKKVAKINLAIDILNRVLIEADVGEYVKLIKGELDG